MFLLVFDTTGPVGSCALIDGQGVVTGRETTEPMAHLKLLLPLTEELLQARKITPTEISAVAASVGPGSYTGIRIGVSSARSMAQALGVPCVKVPTLEMFRLYTDAERDACGVLADLPDLAERTKHKSVAVILNARRGQVYGAVFAKDGTEILAPGPYMLEDVTRAVTESGEPALWFGDGIDAYRENPKFGHLLGGFEFAPEAIRYQNAALAARYAKKCFDEGETVPVDALLPEYMRQTEAEQKLKDGSLKEARERKLRKFMGLSEDGVGNNGE